jgi:dTDP-glucose 4,6-dehydratase
MRAMVTGGAGFIGSALVERLALREGADVMVYDALTYAGRLENLANVRDHLGYRFVKANILDRDSLDGVIRAYRPSVIFHLAAESHVDRSIDHAVDFVRTNVEGTLQVLEAATTYHAGLRGADQSGFRFVHVSTDEVFGALGETGAFSETSPYSPNSPYAASKAGSDLLARAFFRTYQLPTIITNCSNNYGPRQFPEKLIPLCILRALKGESLPIYGRGLQVRDWLYVEDHADALVTVARGGVPGEQYCIGGGTEMSNLEAVRRLCAILDQASPRFDGRSYAEQMVFVADRPGHDFRYSIDSAKMRADLGWLPSFNFDDALRTTVRWYLDNPRWIESLHGDGTIADVTARRGLKKAT